MQAQQSIKNQKASRVGFLWISALLISLSYTKPLAYITPYDRINPRLYDLVILIGIFFVLPKIRLSFRIPFLRTYALILLWFSFCALFYGLVILDLDIGKYSLFFALKDGLNLLVLVIVASIELNSDQIKKLHRLIIWLGVFVALYCIPEYLHPIHSIEVKPGLVVPVSEGIIIGPFSGTTYFTVSMYSALAAAITLSYLFYVKGIGKQLLIIAASLFIAFPAFFSGSRSGVAYIIITLLFMTYSYLFMIRGNTPSKLLKLLLIAFISISLLLGIGFSRESNIKSKTFERFDTFESGGNSVESRLSIYKDFINYDYVYSDYLPFIGAGYGVAPLNTTSGAHYRIGYGFHNAYLKNYEQGGILPFILFFIFLYRIYKILKKRLSSPSPTAYALAIPIFSYLVAAVIGSLVGVGPWDSSVGVLYLSIVLLSLKPSTCRTTNSRKKSPNNASDNYGTTQ